MARPRFVTLTSDIGWAYAAQMKAVLARRAPNATVVDIAHDLRPQAIAEAAFLLGHIAPQFPPGTVHVAVVDPGVGGQRAPVAVETADGSFLVGPDNGVLSIAALRLGTRRVVRLRPASVVGGRRVSSTFEGRDLFAPAAAALATGARIERLGPQQSLQGLPMVPVLRRPRRAGGRVVHVDVFGNAITNLPATELPPDLRAVTVVLRGRKRAARVPVLRTYEAGRAGSLGILRSSFGLLELAVRNGSASSRLGLKVGDALELRWHPRRRGAGK